MTDYIPQHPPRHEQALSIINLLRMGRKNLLSIWCKKDFERCCSASKVNKSVICPAYITRQ